MTYFMDDPLCRPHPRNSVRTYLNGNDTRCTAKKEQAVKAKITAPRPSIEGYEALLAGCHVTDWGCELTQYDRVTAAVLANNGDAFETGIERRANIRKDDDCCGASLEGKHKQLKKLSPQPGTKRRNRYRHDEYKESHRPYIHSQEGEGRPRRDSSRKRVKMYV